ncbi:hypothetical protein [Mycobacterium sp. SA01]|uniref:hypothetical protein n=1 Tax=Mycobacterium sp. SA01 TaxID=3238820 RepID=UPI00351AF7FF
MALSSPLPFVDTMVAQPRKPERSSALSQQRETAESAGRRERWEAARESRDAAIIDLADEGATVAEIAAAAGLTEAKVLRILDGS